MTKDEVEALLRAEGFTPVPGDPPYPPAPKGDATVERWWEMLGDHARVHQVDRARLDAADFYVLTPAEKAQLAGQLDHYRQLIGRFGWAYK